MGSSIANIFAAFGLGLLFAGPITFDRSSKIYAALLLGLTTTFLLFLVLFSGVLKRLAGILLVLLFVVYAASVATLIYKGSLVAPEGDSDGSSSDSPDDTSDNDSSGYGGKRIQGRSSSVSMGQPGPGQPRTKRKMRRIKRPRQKPTRYHVIKLFTGLAALLLASYVVSHSAATIGASLSLPDTVIGTTLVSFATTIPEKFVAVMGGMKKQPGIMVATSVGSNIFLATLCGGVLFLGGNLGEMQAGFTAREALVMWSAAAIVCGIVLTGANRWVGGGLLLCYVTFFGLEFSSGGGLAR